MFNKFRLTFAGPNLVILRKFQTKFHSALDSYTELTYSALRSGYRMYAQGLIPPTYRTLLINYMIIPEKVRKMAAAVSADLQAHHPDVVDDDFRISPSKPRNGRLKMALMRSVDQNLGTLMLCAVEDELQKLLDWMEDIAREEAQEHTLLLSNEQVLHLIRFDSLSEADVKPSCRFLEELVPSPLALLIIRTFEGRIYSFFIKSKHFITNLYMQLLFRVARHINYRFIKQNWFVYLPKKPENKRTDRYVFYDSIKSPLLEWYGSSTVRYCTAHPSFKTGWIPPTRLVIDMWADFGGSIFWDRGAAIGGVDDLSTNDNYYFDFSDIPELTDWYNEFHDLAFDLEDAEEELPPISPRVIAWHLRGLKLAQQIRPRLPLNIDLVYSLSWDTVYPSLYNELHAGHLVYDTRWLKFS